MNPSFDVEGNINRSLEPEEALFDLKKKFPELDIGLRENQGAEFREFLSDFGIDNEKIQNLVAMQDPPLSEEELGSLSYLLNNRPPHSLKVDESLKAPITDDLHKYIKHPDRLDMKGQKF